MTTEEEEKTATLLNEAMKPLEDNLTEYGKVSKRIFDMIINNFEFKTEINYKQSNI